ncbi:regulator of CtrA degradation [Azospirillum agricola]|nr:regulator of CtrA degradation [Azospirillum agricola]
MMVSHTFFFNGPYDETMALLIEARNYIAYYDVSEHRKLSPQVRLQISYESMRVTSRLTQVMAWLLAQKAVHAGEITREQAAGGDFSLTGGEICSDPSGPENEELPAGLRSLLERSHNLYMRIDRLDSMLRADVQRAAEAEAAVG